jgi:hypothetical protein
VKRAALALLFVSSVARAEPLDSIPDGAPIYGQLRPLAVMGALKRLGAGELPAVKALRAQLGGLDVLDPTLLQPTGLDVAAPMWGVIEPMPGKRLHHRVVAQLRDPALFKAFLAGVAASKQLPLESTAPESPLGRQGVIATMKLGDGGEAIARVRETTLVIDSVQSVDHGHGKPIAPAEMAKKLALAAAKPFRPEHGARQLFSPEAGFAIYLDGRKLQPLIEVLGENVSPACVKDWSRAPAAFDDVGLAVAADPDGLALSLAWGTQGRPPLGGFRMKPVDDGAFDAALLKNSPAGIALYAASLTAFTSLPRSGPLATHSTLTASLLRCGPLAYGAVFARSWPQALGAVLTEALGAQRTGSDPMMSRVLDMLGQLRNVVAVLRDGGQVGARWALGATLDAPAKALLALTLGLTSTAPAQPMTVGSRSPSVYHVSWGAVTAAAGLESLPSGVVSFTIADSDDSLGWSLRRATPAADVRTPAEPLPIAAAFLDGVQVAKLLPWFHLSRSDQKSLGEVFSHLRHVEARLTADPDLFRLTIRAPLKQ